MRLTIFYWKAIDNQSTTMVNIWWLFRSRKETNCISKTVHQWSMTNATTLSYIKKDKSLGSSSCRTKMSKMFCLKPTSSAWVFSASMFHDIRSYFGINRLQWGFGSESRILRNTMRRWKRKSWDCSWSSLPREKGKLRRNKENNLIPRGHRQQVGLVYLLCGAWMLLSSPFAGSGKLNQF